MINTAINIVTLFVLLLGVFKEKALHHFLAASLADSN